MPYDIKSVNGGFDIVKKDTGKVVGHSKTRKDAEASIRARFAGEYGNTKEAEFIPPEAGTAPRAVKNILTAVYSSIRSKWVKDHPSDKENADNKTSAAKQAWGAVANAGWSKDARGEWHLKEEKYDPLTGRFEVKEGGSGSGNFGHSGRPGERGGSGEGGSK